MSEGGTRRSRLLLILLAVSVAVNLFLGGLWVGSNMRGDRHTVPDPVEFNFRGLRHAIQGKNADEFRSIMREKRSDVRTRMREQRELHRSLRKALTAPVLDMEEVGNLLDRQRALSGEFRRPLHEALMTMLPRMTLEERRALVQTLSEYNVRHRKRRDRRGEDDKPRRKEQPSQPVETGSQ